ncbi:MAG: MBL fold metallo-hydrolase [Bacteroidota bacterium]
MHSNKQKFDIAAMVCFVVIFIIGCSTSSEEKKELPQSPDQPYALILGIAQDAGYPQQGCYKVCCKDIWDQPSKHRSPACLAVIDPISKEKWLFEATPNVKTQLDILQNHTPEFSKFLPDGVFLTHAHIGHYTGLIQFGHEVMGTNDLPVYAMPKMCDFLTNHGPWSQLVDYRNISLQELQADSTIQLNERISVTPFKVPHRDEFSETVGYHISAKEKSLIFIPDIDKWEKWDHSITDLVSETTYALLDGTFYKNGEIPGRDMSQIPHPFIEESMTVFEDLSPMIKSGIYFFHFNHTNPVLRKGSIEREEVEGAGFKVAEEGMVLEL